MPLCIGSQPPGETVFKGIILLFTYKYREVIRAVGNTIYTFAPR